MNNIFAVTILTTLNVSFILHAELTADRMPAYPPAKVDAVVDEIYGVKVPDPYRWLERADDQEVQAWIKSEDVLAREQLKGLPGRESIAKRFRELSFIEDVNVPVQHGNRHFCWRRQSRSDKSSLYWKEGKDGEEKILFPADTWTNGHLSVGTYAISEDGHSIVYSLHENNADEGTLYVMDVASGKTSEIDVIDRMLRFVHPCWSPDGKGFYYSYVPNNPEIKIADRIAYMEGRFHKLGEDPKRDKVIYEHTGDPTKFVNISISRDGHWLFSFVNRWTANEVLFKDAHDDKSEWKVLAAQEPFAYSVFSWKDQFYIVTNEGAPNSRLFKVDSTNPTRDHWREIVPERPDAMLKSVRIVGAHLALTYMIHATTTIQLHDLEGKFVRDIKMPGFGTIRGFSGNEENDEAHFIFSSFTTPPQLYQTNITTGELKLLSKLEIPVDPSLFEVEQVWFSSKDGTKISMFLVHKKNWNKDGNNPTLLHGYGGYKVSMTSEFNASLYPLLERGFVCAIANLRGGGEYGEDWHRAGMLEKKQNVFDDFAAAAQYLIEQKITRPERLAISGKSNGGLLVGAFTVQHPGLCKCVVCEVPLLDMLRYHLFSQTSKIAVTEFGSADDPKLFPVLFAYSPYHHIVAGTKYPSLLMLSADSDDRVSPMHARKFVAALQAASSGGPVLLRVEVNAGHTGTGQLKASLENATDKYAFILDQLGVR